MTQAVSGGVRTLLRLEGLGVLIVSVLAYAQFVRDWGNFFLFFLAPDLALLGYAAGARVGTVLYNLSHSLLGPLATLAAGVLLSEPVATAAALIWLAHIGFDRALGYGLKYSAGFGFTHLGTIGRQRAND